MVADQGRYGHARSWLSWFGHVLGTIKLGSDTAEGGTPSIQ
jgi:hypothetical protein